MNLEQRLNVVVKNRLQYSLETAKKRGYRITNGATSEDFLSTTTCCALGATSVVELNLHPNRSVVPIVNVFTFTKLLDLPLEVVDAFLDGYDYETVKTLEPGYPRYRRSIHSEACYIALNLGCHFKRLWIQRQPKRKTFIA